MHDIHSSREIKVSMAKLVTRFTATKTFGVEKLKSLTRSIKLFTFLDHKPC